MQLHVETMSAKGTDTEIETLLEEGLDLYGRGDTSGAIRCWRRVLAVHPGHDLALDYLGSAGADPSAPVPGPESIPPDEEASVLSSPELLRLVKEGQYDAALAILYEARSKNPKDASVSRSIRHLKLRLLRNYARELGNLDTVPELLGEVDITDLEIEEQEIARLVDGISSYEDIIASSPYGRLLTYRRLVGLKRRGLLAAVLDSALPSAELGGLPLPPNTPTDLVGGAPDLPQLLTLLRSPSERPGPASEPAEDDPYDIAFREATKAYVKRNHAEARRLFEECLRLRPGDGPAKHNLSKIAKG